MAAVTKVWLMVTPTTSALVPVVLFLLDQRWVSWKAGAWQPRWPLDPQCRPFSSLRGVSCSSSSHPCWGNAEKDSKSLLCHFPDAHSRRPGLNGWLMAASHRWPNPVCENVVTYFIRPHAIFQMLAHLPSRLFLIWGEELKTAAVAAAVAWRNTADYP